MADVGAADQYFQTVVDAQAWTSATEVQKAAALATAERDLAAYQERADPSRFAYAVYEQALWLLQADVRARLQQAGVSEAVLGSSEEVFRQGGRDPFIAPKAWFYLRGQPKAGVLV